METTTIKTPGPGKATRGASSGQYYYRPLGTDRVYEILEFSRWDIGTKTHWNVRVMGDRDWFDADTTLAGAKVIADNDAAYWEGAV
jgi:hypothetical protein